MIESGRSVAESVHREEVYEIRRDGKRGGHVRVEGGCWERGKHKGTHWGYRSERERVELAM